MDLRKTLINLLPFIIAKKVGPQLVEGWTVTKDFKGEVLNPLESSTCTVNGKFTNILFDERKDMGLFTNPKYPLIHIGSNYGELYSPEFLIKGKEEFLASNYDYLKVYQSDEKEIIPLEKKKKSNRGRKPKEKDPKSRRVGNGKYFNSQTTFVWVSENIIPKKPDKTFVMVDGVKKLVDIYKIKVFRNGSAAIPGVVKLDLQDSEPPIKYMETYLSEIFKKEVKMTDLKTELRNCKTMLNDPEMELNFNQFGKLLLLEKYVNPYLKILDVEYMTVQKSAQIKIKFHRPQEGNPTKYATVKILRRKIDFEGFSHYHDIITIYNWLNIFMINHYKDITTTSFVGVDSSDEDEVQLKDEVQPKNEEKKRISKKKKVYQFDTYNIDGSESD